MDGDDIEADETEDREAILATLAQARLDHAVLSAEVEALQAQPMPDQLRLARFKKQKLLLKDRIVRLENMLTPDLIA